MLRSLSILHKYLLNSVPRAVVTVYGTGYKNPAALKAVEAVLAEGRVLSINSQITITNGDSIASVYFVGRVPSNAIIKPTSRVDCAAITSVTSMHLGFTGAASALVSAQDISSATNFSAVKNVSVANLNTRAWQLAGLTADPGGVLDIFATINVAATATGQVNFSIDYSRH